MPRIRTGPDDPPPPESEAQLRRTLAIFETKYGRHHPQVAIHLVALAQFLQGTRQLAEAQPIFRHALLILLRSSRVMDHPDPMLRPGLHAYVGLCLDMRVEGGEIVQRLAALCREAGLAEDQMKEIVALAFEY